jgi:cytolysin (calcineurin-like family phosphatase)
MIDELDLKIGKVIYKDYTKGGSPSVKEFNVGIEEHYTNIDNPYAFASLVVFKALANTNVASMANFDLNGLKAVSSEAMTSAKETVKQAAEGIKKVLPFGK